MPKHSKRRYVGADLGLTSRDTPVVMREGRDDEREKEVSRPSRRDKSGLIKAQEDFTIQRRVQKVGRPGPKGAPYTGRHTTIPPRLAIEISDANDMFSRARPYPDSDIFVVLAILWSSLLIKQTRENALGPQPKKWKRLPPIADSVGILALLKLLIIPHNLPRKELVAYFNRFVEDEVQVSTVRNQLPPHYQYLVPHFRKRRVKHKAKSAQLNGSHGEVTGVDDHNHDFFGYILNTLRRVHQTNYPEELVEVEFMQRRDVFECTITVSGHSFVGCGLGRNKKAAKNNAARHFVSQLNGANGEFTGTDDHDCSICDRPLTRFHVNGQRKPNNYLLFLAGCAPQCAFNVCINCHAQSWSYRMAADLNLPIQEVQCPGCRSVTFVPEHVLPPYLSTITNPGVVSNQHNADINTRHSLDNWRRAVRLRAQPPVTPPTPRRMMSALPDHTADPYFNATPIPDDCPALRPLRPAGGNPGGANPPALVPNAAPNPPPAANPLVQLPVAAPVVPPIQLGPVINAPAPVVVNPAAPPGPAIPVLAAPVAPLNVGNPVPAVAVPPARPPRPAGVVPPAPAAPPAGPPQPAPRVLAPPVPGRIHVRKNYIDLFLIDDSYAITYVYVLSLLSALFYQRTVNVIPLVLGPICQRLGLQRCSSLLGIVLCVSIALVQHGVFGDFLASKFFVIENVLTSRSEVRYTIYSLAWVNFLHYVFIVKSAIQRILGSKLGALQEFGGDMLIGLPYWLSHDLVPIDPTYNGFRNVMYYADVAAAVKGARSSSLDSTGLVRYVEDTVQKEVIGVVGLDSTVLANTRFIVYQSIVAERLLDREHITSVVDTVSNLKW